MTTYHAITLSPIIPSTDLTATTNFLVRVLGFSIEREEHNYVILHKTPSTLHIQRAGEGVGEMALYLEVDEVDALWEQIKDQLRDVRVKAPFDQPYGMREIHIILPATNALLFIGSVVTNAGER